MTHTNQVSIAVKGKFHAFHMARQFSRLGLLNTLYTTYPAFDAKKYQIPVSNIKAMPSYELQGRLFPKLIKDQQARAALAKRLTRSFDDKVSRLLTATTRIFIGWTGCSFSSLQRAKALGAITILESGSTHILTQIQLLREEYERFGVAYHAPPSWQVKQILKEIEIADYISIPSTFVANSFLAHGVAKEKLLINPYGVDIERFPLALPKADNTFRIVFCGSQRLRKGVYYLLRAFTELNLANSECVFVGEMLPETEAFFQQFKHPNITQIPSQKEFNLYHHYHKASVFCLPSIEEGLALVSLQALSCGIPIVASDNTGVADVITPGQEGFLFPIRDVETLKIKLKWLYDNPQARRDMATRAHQLIQDRFTWDAYGMRWADNLNEVIRQRDAAPIAKRVE